jgi:hypothetical protein
MEIQKSSTALTLWRIYLITSRYAALRFELELAELFTTLDTLRFAIWTFDELIDSQTQIDWCP